MTSLFGCLIVISNLIYAQLSLFFFLRTLFKIELPILSLHHTKSCPVPVFSNSVSDTSTDSASKARNSGAILECQFQLILGPSWPVILHCGMIILPLNFRFSLACSLTLPQFTLLRDSDSTLPPLGFLHVLKEVNPSCWFCFTSF